MKGNISSKKILLQLLVIIAIIVLLNITASTLAPVFQAYLFTPLQTFRCWLFQFVPFSLGDAFYLIGGIFAIYLFVNFVKKIFSKKEKAKTYCLLRGVRNVSILYLALLILWGVQYEQPKLSQQLSLPEKDSVTEQELMAFDSVLISRLNALQPEYACRSLKDLNEIAAASYKQAGTPMKVFAKETLLGSKLEYFAIEGYFNPFTGEAQVNNNNLHFMQAFVVAHEMAHQTGIAAEDDANLMAYIRCVESGNASLQYSAYFNIWLYTHRRVRGIDSNAANALKKQLNTISLAQLDTLRQRRMQYQTVLDDISTFIFDAYLKMGKQTEGIGSYRNVAYSALCWEKKRYASK